MAREEINNGAYDNDPLADDIREGFEKVNANFEEIFDLDEKVPVSLFLGYILNPGTGPFNMSSEVAASFNARPQFTLSPKATPLFVSAVLMVPGDGYNYASSKYIYVLKKPPGKYGSGSGTTVSFSSFELVGVQLYTANDLVSSPDVTVIPLEVPDGENFWDVANESYWNWSDSGDVSETGIVQYYFTFEKDGELQWAYFTGAAGVYGAGATPFTEAMFKVTIKGNPTPDKTKLSEFTNDGEDGLNPFITAQLWEPGPYKQNQVVRKVINGRTCLFRSMSDNNTTEPIIYKHIEAWLPYYLGGSFAGDWTGSATAGNIYVQEGFAYRCWSNNTSSPRELTAGHWFKIGQYFGLYNGGTVYNNGNVVTDADNNVLVSQINHNTFPLDYGIISDWEFLTGDRFTIVVWGNSIAKGSGSTGEGNFPDVLAKNTGFNVINMGVPGETSGQILARFNAHPELWKYPTVLEMGQNNPDFPDDVKDDIAEAVSKLTHGQFLIVGLLKPHGAGGGLYEPLNADLEAVYESRFLNVQEYLISKYDDGNPQDVADHAAGRLPWSKLSDWLHLSNAGYADLANLITSRLNYLMYRSDARYRNLHAESVQVTNNVSDFEKTEGLHLAYDKTTGKAFIIAYDYKTGTVKEISIGYNPGSNTSINENGGLVYIGGNVNVNGDIELIGLNVSGSAFFGSASPESGYPFQIASSFAIGAAMGDPRLYGFKMSDTVFGLQVRDESIQQFLKIFTAGIEFDSKVKMLAGSASNEGVTFQQLYDAEVTLNAEIDAVAAQRPYKVYTAFMAQSGTGAPTVTVLQNSLGAAITWAYITTGQYSGTLTGAFTLNKTYVDAGLGNSNLVTSHVRGVHTDVDTVTINTYDGSGVATNSVLQDKSLIEIRVYN